MDLYAGDISCYGKLEGTHQEGMLVRYSSWLWNGTEQIIHRILNRSLLVGSISISVELAIAIITIIFFHMNTKKMYKDVFGDAHLQVGVPVEWVTARENLDTHCEESIEPIKEFKIGTNVRTALLWKKEATMSCPKARAGFF